MNAIVYGKAAAAFQQARTTAIPFEAVLIRLRQAIEAAGLNTVIRWHDPATAFGRYGDPVLTDMGQDLAARCRQLVTAIQEGVQPCRSHVST